MTTGQAIQELRLRRELTQKQLGEQLGMWQNDICAIENDKRGLSRKKLRQFAEFFGTTAGKLVDGEVG